MNLRLAALISAIVLTAPLPSLFANPEDSVVKVLVTVRHHDITKPWTKGNTVETHGTGVVIDGKRVLTNAHVVSYATEVHVQGRPGDEKFEAKVQAVAGDVDLALLTVEDARFFDKRPPLPRANGIPKVPESVTVYGFPIGGTDLSITKGELARIVFSYYGTRGMGMVFQITAAVNPGNSGGPAVAGGKMIGLVFSRPLNLQQIGSVIANEEIELFLDDCRDGRYDGKAVEATGTLYQHLENEGLRRMLKLDPATKGILVRPQRWRDADYPLQPFDVITKVGEHALDNTGMARLASGMHVPGLYLISRLAQTGKIPLTVWRQGKMIEASLPVTRQDVRLLKSRYGAPPQYFIHGPLVFAAASSDDVPMLTPLNPTMYSDNSPLVNRALENVAFPGEELVIVSAPMFAHKIAKGYGSPAGKTVREVNGVRIKNLRHLVETLRDAAGDLVRIDLADDWAEILVFDRKALERATEEILDDHGIVANRRGSPALLKVWQEKSAK